ncbi:GTPase [Candidatus Micrarchaeota archaeon]|nr:GTPase [Candidatus Micrarchaeota archaeon]
MRNAIIIGAAGRDFHNFNVFFRNNAEYRVVAFTAAQIPKISGRKYPKELAGKRYPKGIPIYEEEKLPSMIKKLKADVCVLAYSDLKHEDVMHKASLVNAAGADFWLLGNHSTMIRSKRPVIAVCAVRTGAGKSQTTRYVADILKKMKKRVVAVRHPMPYGNLVEQSVQRFETYDDLTKARCTLEEREEYEPLISRGIIVYAGVDYEKILRRAEREADVIIWDGGNNDTPFYEPTLMITVADALRPGHEILYYPGETNARMADVVIINKINTAEKESVERVVKNIVQMNPDAEIILGTSAISVKNPRSLAGRRVVVVEDGPTLTHGGMSFGAGMVIAKRLGCHVIPAKNFAAGSLRGVYAKYPQISEILPAMGYYPEQLRDLQATIERMPIDAVISGTPIDFARLVHVNKPVIRVFYELEEDGSLEKAIKRALKR